LFIRVGGARIADVGPRCPIHHEFQKERTPSRDQNKGKWKQARSDVTEKWGELTDDELDVIDGQRDQFVGAVQERYGVAREDAEKQVRQFESS